MLYIWLLVILLIVIFIVKSTTSNKQEVLNFSENSEPQLQQKTEIQKVEKECEIQSCADYSHGLREKSEQEISYGSVEVNLTGGKREFGELICKPLEIFNDFGQISILPGDMINILFAGKRAIINTTILLPNDQKNNLQDAVVKCKNFLKVMKIRTDHGERIIYPMDSTMIFFKEHNPNAVPNAKEALVSILRNYISEIEIEAWIQKWQSEGSSDTKSLIFNLEFTIIHEIIRSIVIKHIKVLAKKRQRGVFQDEYGIERSEKWGSELDYFFEKVLVPELSTALAREQTYPFQDSFIIKKLLIEKDEGCVKTTLEFIDNIVKVDDYVVDEDLSSMDGHEYEHYVADLIRECGWNAFVTKASGDHGADIIAEKEGFRLAIQCKLYTSPVGNKSVQEVYAAKAHYECNAACVVTNSGFTPNAKEVANTTGVALLHHGDLVDFLSAIESNSN